ncbi:MAG: hypothetical protein Q9166_001189 [cf. Caloplaca sp. 2 TL-2023]
MSVLLGKRKRREHAISSFQFPDTEVDQDNIVRLKNLLRQNFETRFEPLETFDPPSARKSFPEEFHASDGDEVDWTGFPEEDQEEAGAIIVDYQHQKKTKADFPKEDLKLFMSAKPPLGDIEGPSSITAKEIESQVSEEAATDAANLKKDLALQRLLQESHLLDPRSSLAPSGQNRHKALDVRQQALGSKSSIFTQQKMPLAQRKGITAKAAEREDKRRREAKESGIILEKATKLTKRDPKRERGVGAPSVGRFSRGTLTLSKRDVIKIVGTPKRSKRR